MRPSTNAELAPTEHSAFLETGLEAPDITLECYNGHISLIEFVNLKVVAGGQPSGFLHAFRKEVDHKIKDAALAWSAGKVDHIRLKMGWVGENLLLIGFEQEMTVTAADERMKLLIRSFADIRTLCFADAVEKTNHEIFLNNIKPLYSMVTRPKIMTYDNLASILINDVQLKKAFSRCPTATPGEDVGSAIWASNPTQSMMAPASASEQRYQNYQENTKRFLRKSFRDHKLNLTALPVINLVTQQWESLSVSVGGLATLMRNTDLNKETLGAVADSLAMRWELDTAVVSQVLHDMSRAPENVAEGQYRVNIPVSFETVVCWSRFKSDICDVLDAHPSANTRKLRLMITSIGDTLGVMDSRQLVQINRWLKETRDKYGIQFFAQWENLDTREVALQPLEVDGIRLNCTTCDDVAIERTESVVKNRNRYRQSLAIMLSNRFSDEARALAARKGVECAEQRADRSDSTQTFGEKLVRIQYKNQRIQATPEIVDARRQFLQVDTE